MIRPIRINICVSSFRFGPGRSGAAFYNRARAEPSKVAELTVPPRDAKAFKVAAGLSSAPSTPTASMAAAI
jgi:hypothetical protein